MTHDFFRVNISTDPNCLYWLRLYTIYSSIARNIETGEKFGWIIEDSCVLTLYSCHHQVIEHFVWIKRAVIQTCIRVHAHTFGISHLILMTNFLRYFYIIIFIIFQWFVLSPYFNSYIRKSMDYLCVQFILLWQIKNMFSLINVFATQKCGLFGWQYNPGQINFQLSVASTNRK